MIFGDHLSAADSAAPAEWIEGACRGAWGTVGALVPNHFPAIVRVWAPDPIPDDWWTSYCDLHEIVASVGERHTTSPAHAWFAVWEGHGFDRATTHYAWFEPPRDDATRHARDEERARLRDDDERRNSEIRAALGRIPRFALPNRAYYLVEGPVTAATQLRYPDAPNDWRNPDLFWPDDRRWFVATDVDFWSLYVAGDEDFVDELAGAVPTRTERVTLEYPLEAED